MTNSPNSTEKKKKTNLGSFDYEMSPFMMFVRSMGGSLCQYINVDVTVSFFLYSHCDIFFDITVS